MKVKGVKQKAEVAVERLDRVSIATELELILEEKEKLEVVEHVLRTRLLENLKEQGVGFVRLDNGTSFTRSHRETLEVADEEKARKWAEEHYCLKIDTGKAMTILRRELKMPKFFKRKIGDDYLTIKYAPKNEF